MEAVDANGIRNHPQGNPGIDPDGNPSDEMEWRREVIDTKKEASEKVPVSSNLSAVCPTRKLGSHENLRRMKKIIGVPWSMSALQGDRVLIQL